MDFFERQDKARKKTKLLVLYFAVAVVLLIALTYVATMLVFFGGMIKANPDAPLDIAWWNPKIFLCVAAGTLAVISIGSIYKISELSGGGGSVATLMGGRLVQPNTIDPDERKLLNVVEEMAIASGVPVPKVYVLDMERAINAFAAGHNTGDAAIGLTRGCIQLLTRDELQGVIAHEFSHILNGDMRLNLRLIGIIFGILCLATIGRILLRTRGRKNPLPVFGLVLLVLGGVGVFFGRLIQAAVSRQREFLADASSVQFTRNPPGLSGALQKIGRFGLGSRLGSAHAPELCHMFFGNGLGDSFFEAMATHPPIPDRIRAIDPAWDGTFPPLTPTQIEVVKNAAISDMKRSSSTMPDIFGNILGGAIIASGNVEKKPAAPKPPVIKTRSVMPNLGKPTPLHLEYAVKMRDALPESIKAAAREPLDAVALIYALLLSPDGTTRATQLAGLASRVEPAIHQKTAALYPKVSSTTVLAHLPIINLALGTLRNLRADDFHIFSQTLQWLIESDEKIELFEFVMQKIVLHHLAPQFGETCPATVQFYTLKPLVPDCAVVLSALANVGQNDPAAISKAFEAGAPYLRAPNDHELQLLPREQCGVQQLDPALDRLTQAVPIIKKNLLEACVRTVGMDGVIQEAEAELLRAIADTLDCPIPPFVQIE